MLVACQPFSAELGDALGAQPQALRVVHFEIQQQPLHVTDGHFATARCQAIRIEVHRGAAAGGVRQRQRGQAVGRDRVGVVRGVRTQGYVHARQDLIAHNAVRQIVDGAAVATDVVEGLKLPMATHNTAATPASTEAVQDWYSTVATASPTWQRPALRCARTH